MFAIRLILNFIFAQTQTCVTGLPLYDFLLELNNNIRPNFNAFWGIKVANMYELELDLSGSLKGKMLPTVKYSLILHLLRLKGYKYV